MARVASYRVLASFAAGVLICTASCSSTSTPSARDDSSPAASTAILLDESLASIIQLQEQSGQRDPATGAFIAQTLITNKGFEWIELECRTLFKDTDGNTVESSPWKTLRLDPASRLNYAAPSLKPEATRFMTQIRKAPKGRPAPGKKSSA
jgi:hypothetical protein